MDILSCQRRLVGFSAACPDNLRKQNGYRRERPVSQSFYNDNGSQYINPHVVKLLDKIFSLSRANPFCDKAMTVAGLVKNEMINRLGYRGVSRNASRTLVNAFCGDRLIP